MINLQEEQEKKARCLLIGAPNKTDAEPQELISLIDTLGMEVADTMVLARIEPTPAYGIGTGKAQEIANRAKDLNADCIIFDWEIDPTKQRNWEKLTGINVFDRNEVIIRIFSQRAQTKEAVLQVQMAKLTYSLPRLSHMYGNLSRQRGGNYGAKGSGETQLELDRRQIEDKILQLKKELDQVSMNRKTQRKMRERNAQPSCSLVGYTNAGKSSLLNALTGADTLVENKLFATLDPTTRKLALSEASQVLLTDTVGFISNLPHSLIDAFRSTLEEAASSDLLLIVVDAGDPDYKMQYKQVLKVLEEIHADKIQSLVVLNKIDTVRDNPPLMSELEAEFPDAIKTCAKDGSGFDELIAKMTVLLLGELRDFKIPLTRSDLVELARKNGTIENEQWLEDGVKLTARIPGNIEDGNASTRTLALMLPFVVE